jgi:hypothetical protein
LIGTYATGSGPYSVATDGTSVWVANANANTVTKLQASTGALIGTYATGSSPLGVATDGTFVWVANRYDNTVTKLTSVLPVADLPVMVGATSSIAGTAGIVPAPAGGQNKSPLLGSATFTTAPTTADALSDVTIAASATTQKPLVVQGKASQTANLQEWQDSTGTVKASISPAGVITGNGSGLTNLPAASNPAARVTNAADQAVGSGSALNFDTVVFADTGMRDSMAISKLVAPSAGRYLVTFIGKTTGSTPQYNLRKNGTQSIGYAGNMGSSGGTIATLIDLAANDFVEVLEWNGVITSGNTAYPGSSVFTLHQI